MYISQIFRLPLTIADRPKLTAIGISVNTSVRTKNTPYYTEVLHDKIRTVQALSVSVTNKFVAPLPTKPTIRYPSHHSMRRSVATRSQLIPGGTTGASTKAAPPPNCSCRE